MRIETSDIYELPDTNRIGHTCANLNGELFFIWGGSDDNNNQNAHEDSRHHNSSDNNAAQLWIYETLTGYWRRRECSGECPPNLSGSTSCLIGRRMFVFGGHSLQLDNWLNNLYCLNLDTFNWTDLSYEACAEPVPPIRCDKSCSWAYNSRFYAFGGYGWVQTEHLLQLLDIQKDLQLTPDMRWLKIGWNNQLVEYSTNDNTWRWPSYSGQCPSARAAHSGTLMGNKYYLFGGRNYQERLNDLYTLNMDTFEWTQVANFANSSLPAPSSSASLLRVSLPITGDASPSRPSQLDHQNGVSSFSSIRSNQLHTEREQATIGLDAESEMDYFLDSSDDDCEQEDCFREAEQTNMITVTTNHNSINANNNNDSIELRRVASQTFPSCSSNTKKQDCASLELEHHSNDDDRNQSDAMSEDAMSVHVFIEQQQQDNDNLAQDLQGHPSHYNRHDSLASSTHNNQLISRSSSSNRNLDHNSPSEGIDEDEIDNPNNDNENNLNVDHGNGNNQNNITSNASAEPSSQPKPTGRSFASFTPISARDIILFGGISSQDEVLDDCWLFNVDFNRWTKLDLRQAKPRLWHSGSRTRNNELVVIGGSSSNKVDEFCSDVLTISMEPKSLKQHALDSVARSIRMKFINKQSSLPQTLIRLIKLRKQAIMLTMRSRQLKHQQQNQHLHEAT